MITGKHLIAGNWVGGGNLFESSPSKGPSYKFSVGNPKLVDKAAKAAEEAFPSYGYITRNERAVFLNRIADEIEKRGDEITEIGCQETGLPEARLEGERARTVGQLRLFAEHIENGDYLDRRHDLALPNRVPLPRPDLRLIQRPIGPVAVFGASNFPLAFSVAGGDTAAALAAGCPVIVKGHSAHPGTSEIVAQAIDDSIKACNMHPGTVSVIQGGARDVGQALVQHPLIKAVGFTGSLAGGKALFDFCAAREEPIPFFGELGSINPMFLLPQAIANRGGDIASGWVGSLTMGAGQFCTNPGIAIVIDGADAANFINDVTTLLSKVDSQMMLTDGISKAYRVGCERMSSFDAVGQLKNASEISRTALPQLFVTTGKTWLTNFELSEEVFGPSGLVVKVADFSEMMEIATKLTGQLTCTLHMDDSDQNEAKKLLPILERKAGRILANGFSTGVEVCESMVHGGPFPASTNFGATSVGTMSIRRFLRPVCYQNMPTLMLPTDMMSH